MITRQGGRRADQLRGVSITRHYARHAEGSALIECGQTLVLCTASVEEGVPPFLTGKGGGWLSAEYGMLPRATNTRMRREAAEGKQSGRTQEIQRLIGRSLRAVADLSQWGERTIRIDCDVLQADGGTRCASITGACVALHDAVAWCKAQGLLAAEAPALRDFVAAVSVGIVDGRIMIGRRVLASGNSGKLREFRRLLTPLGIEVIAQAELGIAETGEPHHTFVENALTKARHASSLAHLPALADDSGICVDALNGAPGVQSARFAGELPSDARNNAKLVEKLAGIADRRAHYYCMLALMRHVDDPEPVLAEGRWEGTIIDLPRGSGGFGYDPHFLDVETGLTGAELPLEKKNELSHSGKAVRAPGARPEALR